MVNREVRLVILCEDLQQEVFARTFFLRRGFERRKIRSKVNPKGKGSGEQWVRECYPLEVQAYRRKNAENVCLAVITDADLTHTVQERLHQLDKVLETSGHEKRQPHERIAIFTPKRNIETWIHYLMTGVTEDEETEYPHFRGNEGRCKSYVEKLVEEICPKGLPEDAPPSLQAACQELQRIH